MASDEVDLDQVAIDSTTYKSFGDDNADAEDASLSDAAFASDVDPSIDPVVNKDHPELTNRESWGWYLYDGANSVYSSVAISGYLPVLVTDMAKYAAADSTDHCQVYIGAIGLRPAAYASAVISISVILQTILFILTTAMADYGNLRKRMLVGTAFLGAILTAAYIFLTDYRAYWLAGLLLIVTNVLFGYSVIFYNAFLPQLVRSSREYLSAPRSERLKVFDEVGNHMSTRGFMVGYAGGVFLLVVTIPIVFLVQGDVRPFWECKVGADPVLVSDKTDATFAYRITALLTGIWWFGFTWFTYFWVNPRPGPVLPAGQNYVTVSLKSVAETARHVKKLPNTMLFLVAYFLFSDGYTTVSSVGVLFATQEMNVQSYVLGIMLVVVPFAALIGNWVWLKIKNRFDIATKKMIMFTIVCMLTLPAYACLGFIESSPIGLKQVWELYVFAAWFGFNVGAIQSFTRTTYMALTPPGHESEFFGLFELTDKGSSWIGPAVVSALVQATGSLRYGNIWLIISFVIPLIMLVFVDVDKGVHDAKHFAEIKSGGYPRRNSINISELEDREVTL